MQTSSENIADPVASELGSPRPEPFEAPFRAASDWSASRRITIEEAALPASTAARFDGLSVVLNSAYTFEERTYYLVHAIGSIILWSKDKTAVQSMFDELRAAKDEKTDNARLESAIARYRAFETESSELAVGLLKELGLDSIVGSYSNFMHADLESMTEFHRTGRAPVWRIYFERWNKEVESGKRRVLPFKCKSVPPFQPIWIEPQEVLQNREE